MAQKITIRTKIRNLFIYSNLLFPVYLITNKIQRYFTNTRYSDEAYLKKIFKKYQGYNLDLKNPKTLNEKLQWLKIHDRKDFHTIYADKYLARDYIRNTFGEEYLIPLVFHTTDYREVKPENMPDFPFIIKANHDSGSYRIIRDKSKIDWKHLRMDCRKWLQNNYYYADREWQYTNIKPRIIVEKLLLTKKGKIPDDYKLNFIEGKLEFIYVSVDREGKNNRNIYDADWNPMNFTWVRRGKDLSKLRGEDIPPPNTLKKMIEFGEIIAKQFKYVRVDYYEVDGVLFFGEITQCHGGGFDQIQPFEYDIKLGEKVDLSRM